MAMMRDQPDPILEPEVQILPSEAVSFDQTHVNFSI